MIRVGDDTIGKDALELHESMARHVRGLETRAEMYYETPAAGTDTPYYDIPAAAGWTTVNYSYHPAQVCIRSDRVFMRGHFIKTTAGTPPSVFGYLPPAFRPAQAMDMMVAVPSVGPGEAPGKINPIFRIYPDGTLKLVKRINLTDGSDAFANQYALGIFGVSFPPKSVVL